MVNQRLNKMLNLFFLKIFIHDFSKSQKFMDNKWVNGRCLCVAIAIPCARGRASCSISAKGVTLLQLFHSQDIHSTFHFLSECGQAHEKNRKFAAFFTLSRIS